MKDFPTGQASRNERYTFLTEQLYLTPDEANKIIRNMRLPKRNRVLIYLAEFKDQLKKIRREARETRKTRKQIEKERDNAVKFLRKKAKESQLSLNA